MMANACNKPNCQCQHTNCDFGYIYVTYVTEDERNGRNGKKYVVKNEYEGVKFCPQCDPDRAHIQETSSSREEMQRRLKERSSANKAEIYEKQEASKTRIL